MIKKLLIANRGEIAVRIIRTCRDLNITALTVYDESDVDSLHVLLADETAKLDSPGGYTDPAQLIRLALEHHADAIHPGYSFHSESSEFARACESAGLKFIGPSAETLSACESKISMLRAAKEAGLSVPEHTTEPLRASDMDTLCQLAEKLTYPVAVKSYRGTSGKASRVATDPEQLKRAVQATAREAERILQDDRIYLEKAIQPGRTIQVPFIVDNSGKIVTFSLVDVSIHHYFNRVFCESPAPNISEQLEKKLTEAAIKLVKKLNYNNQGAVEFWLHEGDQFYFTNLLSVIQAEHSVTELTAGVDLVAEQIRIASGKPANSLAEIANGSKPARHVSMQARVFVGDLLRQGLPSAGALKRFRLPGGPNVRVDAYGYGGCRIPIHFDPLLASISVSGSDRDECLRRMRRALRDTAITGVKTNLAHLQAVMHADDIVSGKYNSFTGKKLETELRISKDGIRDLAVVSAVAYFVKTRSPAVARSERLAGGWYEDTRII